MNLNKLLITYKKAKSEMGERPHNKKVEGKNVSCGDAVTLFLETDGGILKDISFKSSGCAVSISSAFLLAKQLKGKSLEEIKRISNEEYLKLIEMDEISSSRRNCVLTPFIALKKSLD